eukprot:scaffold40924_cov34-Attheya_sp.AAC.3
MMSEDEISSFFANRSPQKPKKGGDDTYNTAVVANIGWSDFHLAFAKIFPFAVKSITWAKDKYTPLTLSGVVTGDDKSKQEALCTSLPVVIE